MSYAKRFERMQRVHSRSRVALESDGYLSFSSQRTHEPRASATAATTVALAGATARSHSQGPPYTPSSSSKRLHRNSSSNSIYSRDRGHFDGGRTAARMNAERRSSSLRSSDARGGLTRKTKDVAVATSPARELQPSRSTEQEELDHVEEASDRGPHLAAPPSRRASQRRRSSGRAHSGSGASAFDPHPTSPPPQQPPQGFITSAHEPPRGMPLTARSRKHFESPHRPAAPASASGMVHTPRNMPPITAPAGGAATRVGTDTDGEMVSLHSAAPSSRRSMAQSQVMAAHLQAVAQARTEVERLLVGQTRYEKEVVAILENLERECHADVWDSPWEGEEEENGYASGGGSIDAEGGARDSPAALGRGRPAPMVSLNALQLAEQERDVAIRLLRQFKDEGNAVVQRLYDAVKAHAKENARLLSSVDALQHENKQLRRLFTESAKKGRLGSGNPELPVEELLPPWAAGKTTSASLARDSNNSSRVGVEKSKTELMLEAQIRSKDHIITQMSQLLASADETMLALRRRVEIAEEQKQALLMQAVTTSLSFLGFTEPSPVVSGGSLSREAGARKEGEKESSGQSSGASVDETPIALRRLQERLPGDTDVANVLDLLLAAKARISGLQTNLQEEKEERLKAELLAQRMAVENERTIVLLEQRLRQAQPARGLTVAGGGDGSVTPPTPEAAREKYGKLEIEGDGAAAAAAAVATAASDTHALVALAVEEAAPINPTATQVNQKEESGKKKMGEEEEGADTVTIIATPDTPTEEHVSNWNQAKASDAPAASEALSTPTRQLHTALSDPNIPSEKGRWQDAGSEVQQDGHRRRHHHRRHRHANGSQIDHDTAGSTNTANGSVCSIPQEEDVVVDEDTTPTATSRSSRHRHRTKHHQCQTSGGGDSESELKTRYATVRDVPTSQQPQQQQQMAPQANQTVDEQSPHPSVNEAKCAVPKNEGAGVAVAETPATSLPPHPASAAAEEGRAPSHGSDSVNGNLAPRGQCGQVQAYVGQRSGLRGVQVNEDSYPQSSATTSAAVAAAQGSVQPLNIPTPSPSGSYVSSPLITGRSGVRIGDDGTEARTATSSVSSRRLVLNLSPVGKSTGE